jgi:hypothetical protein
MTTSASDILAFAAKPVAAPAAPAGMDPAWVARSKALDTTDIRPVPGLVRPFMPHQAAAFAYASDSIAKWGFAFLGHDMGLGKTQLLYALIAARLAQHGGYAIAIAPPVAKAGYILDLQACFPHLRFAHLQGRKPRWICEQCETAIVPVYGETRDCAVGGVCSPRLADVPPADIYFLSDDPGTLKAWFVHVEKVERGERFHANAFVTGASILCRDEVHRDKGAMGKWDTSLRAKVMMTVCRALRDVGVPRVVATGTLLTNRVVEAYVPLLAYGGDDVVMALTPGASKPSAFLWRYCDPQQKNIPGRGNVTDFTGNNAGEVARLNEYLRMVCYSRIEKSDLGEGVLPHSGWEIVPTALHGGVLARVERIERDFLAEVLDSEGPEAYYRKSRMEAVQRMMALWQECGVAKAEQATEYVLDLVQQGRKVVVFYEHQAIRDAILRAAVKARLTYDVIDGKNTGDNRIASIAGFQAGHVDMLLCNHKAAGVAVTLTAASDAVFVQVPWSAGTLKQCADRILRVDDITRQRAARGERVTWHVIQAVHEDGRPTFDSVMWDVLERKAQVCDAVNAGKAVTMSDDDIYLAVLRDWFPTAKAQY